MRISDWSSDVCSSDLTACFCRSGFSRELLLPPLRRQGVRRRVCEPLVRAPTNARKLGWRAGRAGEGCSWHCWEPWEPPHSLTLARKSVETGKSVSVRGALGGRRLIEKQKNNTPC